MMHTTIETEHRGEIALTDETNEAVLRRLDFEITGPGVETFKMDVAACSSSSSSSCGTATRRPK